MTFPLSPQKKDIARVQDIEPDINRLGIPKTNPSARGPPAETRIPRRLVVADCITTTIAPRGSICKSGFRADWLNSARGCRARRFGLTSGSTPPAGGAAPRRCPPRGPPSRAPPQPVHRDLHAGGGCSHHLRRLSAGPAPIALEARAQPLEEIPPPRSAKVRSMRTYACTPIAMAQSRPKSRCGLSR